MKLIVLLSSLLGAASLAVADKYTNTFAIYLVAGDVPWKQIVDGTATPESLKLLPTPVISGSELLSYNTTNHTFNLARAARERVYQQCTRSLQVPFVLVAEGEPVYVGVFTTMVSSRSSGVPAILTDRLRMNADGAYDFRIDRGYPGGDFGRGEDRRADKRVISAIEKILGSMRAKHKTVLNPAAAVDAPITRLLASGCQGRRATELQRYTAMR